MSDNRRGYVIELATAEEPLNRAQGIGALGAHRLEDAPRLRSSSAFMLATALAQRILQPRNPLAELEASEEGLPCKQAAR